MKALTIWRPWTWAITHRSPLAKRTENRTWNAPWVLYRDIAIHAGERYDDRDACDFITDILDERPPGKAQCPTGIVAVTRVAGFRGWDSIGSPDDDPWLVGPWGWQLDNVRVLVEPVPCKGAQGLWTLPPDLEVAVRARLGGR